LQEEKGGKTSQKPNILRIQKIPRYCEITRELEERGKISFPNTKLDRREGGGWVGVVRCNHCAMATEEAMAVQK